MPRILAVSGSTVFGLGFEALAAKRPEITYLGSHTVDEALPALLAEQPEVLIIDFAPPGTAELALCRQVADAHTGTAILLLSDSFDDESIAHGIEAGVRGFLLNTADSISLLSALDWLAQGHGVLDPLVTSRVLSWVSIAPFRSDLDSLSEREVEALRLISRGEPNKRIARSMGVSENTVKTYLRRVYKKLDCNSRTSAAARAVRMGLI